MNLFGGQGVVVSYLGTKRKLLMVAVSVWPYFPQGFNKQGYILGHVHLKFNPPVLDRMKKLNPMCMESLPLNDWRFPGLPFFLQEIGEIA